MKGPFTSEFTVIRRQDGGLAAVPYAQEYAPVAGAGDRQPAGGGRGHRQRLASRAFCPLRADAFETDDYYDSDVAWMDLDSPVEVTIGPYETYEDSLFGYKAAYEAFVTVALPAESAALDGFKQELPWLEMNLPIAEEHKNLDRGTESPIRVVDVLFAGGDTKAGVQTLAFNLPNDERGARGEGIEEGDAAQHPAGQVRQDPGADRRARAWRRRICPVSPSMRSSARACITS